MVVHKNKIRYPADLEPKVAELLTALSLNLGINRTKLIRIFIKYGMTNLTHSTAQGDMKYDDLISKEPLLKEYGPVLTDTDRSRQDS